jgi:hypothetical protein
VIFPEIIDCLSLAGDRTKVNDDAFGTAGHRVWVIDGATGLGSKLLPGDSDAAWLARTANRLLHTHHAIRDTAQLVRVVIEGLISAFEAERIAMPDTPWQWPVASFLMLTCHDDSMEAAWLGDCRAILATGKAIYACGETPAGEAQERALADQLGKNATTSVMLRSPDVLTVLREKRASYNKHGAKWLLGLVPEAADHLEVMSFPIHGSVTGLLMSDGFSALELKYQRYDTASLLSAAQEQGLVALASQLRRIEEIEDSDGVQFPRFKRSDDATAILVQSARK